MIGRYLDSLSDAARDRVITAQDWASDTYYDHLTGGRCLVGHVENWGVLEDSQFVMHGNRVVCPGGRRRLTRRFDRGYNRWGERFVRMIKARAGETHGMISQTIATPGRSSDSVADMETSSASTVAQAAG